MSAPFHAVNCPASPTTGGPCTCGSNVTIARPTTPTDETPTPAEVLGAVRVAVDRLPAQNIRGYKTVRADDVQDAINRIEIRFLRAAAQLQAGRKEPTNG